MNAHAANASRGLRFFALVEKEQIILLPAFGSAVDAVYQPLECVLLDGIAATDNGEAPTLGNEFHNLAENRGALGFQNWMVSNAPFAGCKFPSVQLL